MLKVAILSLSFTSCFAAQFHVQISQYKAAVRHVFDEFHKELDELKILHKEQGTSQPVMLRAGSLFKEYTRYFIAMRNLDIFVQQEIQRSLHAMIPLADRVFESALTDYINQLNKKDTYDKTNVRSIACKAQ